MKPIGANTVAARPASMMSVASPIDTETPAPASWVQVSRAPTGIDSNQGKKLKQRASIRSSPAARRMCGAHIRAVTNMPPMPTADTTRPTSDGHPRPSSATAVSPAPNGVMTK